MGRASVIAIAWLVEQPGQGDVARLLAALVAEVLPALQLLAALLDECERRGFRQAFAVIAESEPASVVLHARAGFRPVGTLDGAGWKHGKWLDVFVMQRQLGEGNQSLPERAT